MGFFSAINSLIASSVSVGVSIDFYSLTFRHGCATLPLGALRVANHPKPSAKNAEGETRKKPFTFGDFDRMVERAIRTPARKRAPKSK